MYPRDIPDAFCWSKMGAEAGEGLDAIIRRKEIERKANNGAFTWGVGNPLGDSMSYLLKEDNSPIVIFTMMKSKPKVIDEQPSSLLLWLSYFDADGNEKPLPKYSLLTSRGHTESNQRKRSHYALLCSAKEPLNYVDDIALNAAELRNLTTGKPVGYSQVTSVVKRVPTIAEAIYYKVGFQARLQKEGQVRLARSIKINVRNLVPVIKAADNGDINTWKYEVEKLKNNYSDTVAYAICEPQLSISF